MPKIVDKEEKARAISDAALKVFRRKGYPGTRMVDIAEVADIGKGTVYEYFKNKADILKFAFDQYFSTFTEGAREAMSSATGAADKLLAFVDFALGHIADWEDHCTAYVDYFSSEKSGKGGTYSLSAIYQAAEGMIAGLVKEGQSAGEIDPSYDPQAMGELLVSIYDGIILRRLFDEKGVDRFLLRKTANEFVGKGLLRLNHETRPEVEK